MNSEQDKTMELLTATTPLDMEIQHMNPWTGSMDLM